MWLHTHTHSYIMHTTPHKSLHHRAVPRPHGGARAAAGGAVAGGPPEQGGRPALAPAEAAAQVRVCVCVVFFNNLGVGRDVFDGWVIVHADRSDV